MIKQIETVVKKEQKLEKELLAEIELAKLTQKNAEIEGKALYEQIIQDQIKKTEKEIEQSQIKHKKELEKINTEFNKKLTLMQKQRENSKKISNEIFEKFIKELKVE
jgi:hypothetical protein